MAVTQSSYLTATDFINLKARVKAEMTRRDGNGSLVAYAGTTYDYTVVPAAGVTIKEEHYDKIRDLIAAINATTTSLGAKTVGDMIMAMNTLDANLALFESQARGNYTTTGTGDCSAACTGMCVTQCTTTCGGTCTGTCTGGCTGTCTGSCSGGCDSGCTSCDSTCSGGCDGCSGCSGGCTSSCGGSSCGGGCTSDCGSGCVPTMG